jgi:hypothetical protein
MVTAKAAERVARCLLASSGFALSCARTAPPQAKAPANAEAPPIAELTEVPAGPIARATVSESPDPRSAVPSGRLDADAIQRVFRVNRDSLVRCYEDHLKPCPNLQARMHVRFVIGPDGRVRDAKDMAHDLPDDEIAACVLHVISELRFPPPERATLTVLYPLLFNPGE